MKKTTHRLYRHTAMDTLLKKNEQRNGARTSDHQLWVA